MQHLVQLIPTLRALDLLQAFAAHPAKQALDAGVLLHVVGPAFAHAFFTGVVYLLQSVLKLQAGAYIAQRLEVSIWLMERVALRVNLVDRNVDVQTVSVVMHSTDTLMILIADCAAHAIFNVAQHFA